MIHEIIQEESVESSAYIFGALRHMWNKKKGQTFFLLLFLDPESKIAIV